MYYFIVKQVLSLTSYKVKWTTWTKMCTGQFKGNSIKNNENPFILREIENLNKLSLGLVQRKNSSAPKDRCILFCEPYAW